jgi:hypothetical protein
VPPKHRFLQELHGVTSQKTPFFKLQLQDPSEINGENLNNVRRETSRHFRNKKRETLKDKINQLETNNKNKNIRDLYRGITAFKRGYQPRRNLMECRNGDLTADIHISLSRWKNHSSHLLNVHNVSDVRQIEIHTAEPLAILKLKFLLQHSKTVNLQVVMIF